MSATCLSWLGGGGSSFVEASELYPRKKIGESKLSSQFTSTSKYLPLDYTFCMNESCTFVDCMRSKIPETTKQLSYACFEAEYDECDCTYSCDFYILPKEFKLNAPTERNYATK